MNAIRPCSIGCNGCEECVDYFGPDDAEEIPSDHWVVIEPNGGKCYGGKTLEEACAAALASPVAAEQGEPIGWVDETWLRRWIMREPGGDKFPHVVRREDAEPDNGDVPIYAASPPLLPPKQLVDKSHEIDFADGLDDATPAPLLPPSEMEPEIHKHALALEYWASSLDEHRAKLPQKFFDELHAAADLIRAYARQHAAGKGQPTAGADALLDKPWRMPT